MTILYPDFNDFHMQSFPSKKFYEATKCVGYSNTTDKNFKTMAMSVGSDSDSASASNITAQSSGAASSSTITTTNNKNNKTMGKRTGKRPGRKPAKIDERAKLERSRQSAKECRARKKLRYQYLEELVLNREKAVFLLRDELETCKSWCGSVDSGHVPSELRTKMAEEEEAERRSRAMTSSSPTLDDAAGDITVVDFSSEFSFSQQNNDNFDNCDNSNDNISNTTSLFKL